MRDPLPPGRGHERVDPRPVAAGLVQERMGVNVDDAHACHETPCPHPAAKSLLDPRKDQRPT